MNVSIWQAFLLLILCFLGPILISGAFLQLLKDGGARPEGYAEFVEYQGPLAVIPYAWAVIALIFSLANLQARDLNFGDFLRSPFFVAIWIPLYFLIAAPLAQYPYQAAKPALVLGASLCLIFVTNQRLGTAALMAAVGTSVAFIAFSSLLFSVFVPSYGIALGGHEGLWQGVYAHKNNLANVMQIVFAGYLVSLLGRPCKIAGTRMNTGLAG